MADKFAIPEPPQWLKQKRAMFKEKMNSTLQSVNCTRNGSKISFLNESASSKIRSSAIKLPSFSIIPFSKDKAAPKDLSSIPSTSTSNLAEVMDGSSKTPMLPSFQGLSPIAVSHSQETRLWNRQSNFSQFSCNDKSSNNVCQALVPHSRDTQSSNQSNLTNFSCVNRSATNVVPQSRDTQSSNQTNLTNFSCVNRSATNVVPHSRDTQSSNQTNLTNFSCVNRSATNVVPHSRDTQSSNQTNLTNFSCVNRSATNVVPQSRDTQSSNQTNLTNFSCVNRSSTNVVPQSSNQTNLTNFSCVNRSATNVCQTVVPHSKDKQSNLSIFSSIDKSMLMKQVGQNNYRHMNQDVLSASTDNTTDRLYIDRFLMPPPNVQRNNKNLTSCSIVSTHDNNNLLETVCNSTTGSIFTRSTHQVNGVCITDNNSFIRTVEGLFNDVQDGKITLLSCKQQVLNLLQTKLIEEETRGVANISHTSSIGPSIFDSSKPKTSKDILAIIKPKVVEYETEFIRTRKKLITTNSRLEQNEQTVEFSAVRVTRNKGKQNKELTLKKWKPVVCDEQLIFAGSSRTGAHIKTAAVKKRVNNDLVELVDGTFCNLEGSPLVEGLPQSVSTKIQNGLPARWRYIIDVLKNNPDNTKLPVTLRSNSTPVTRRLSTSTDTSTTSRTGGNKRKHEEDIVYTGSKKLKEDGVVERGKTRQKKMAAVKKVTVQPAVKKKNEINKENVLVRTKSDRAVVNKSLNEEKKKSRSGRTVKNNRYLESKKLDISPVVVKETKNRSKRKAVTPLTVSTVNTKVNNKKSKNENKKSNHLQISKLEKDEEKECLPFADDPDFFSMFGAVQIPLSAKIQKRKNKQFSIGNETPPAITFAASLRLNDAVTPDSSPWKASQRTQSEGRKFEQHRTKALDKKMVSKRQGKKIDTKPKPSPSIKKPKVFTWSTKHKEPEGLIADDDDDDEDDDEEAESEDEYC